MTDFGMSKLIFARRDPAVTRLLHSGLSWSRPWNETLGYTVPLKNKLTVPRVSILDSFESRVVSQES